MPIILILMTVIRNFSELHRQALLLSRRVRVAVCRPADTHTLQAVLRAVEMGFVEAILVGEYAQELLRELPPHLQAHIEHVPAEGDEAAAQKAVQLVHEGRAEILMKGLLNTDVLLRHVLNKDYGLRPEGAVISHIAAFETPHVDRLLLVSDVAVIPSPTLEQRAAQLRYTTAMARSLGIETPRVAMLHCTEKVSEKFPLTLDYVALKERAAAGEFGDVVVDGPLDLACALSPEALADKRLKSPLGGRADVLLMPDIQAGNVLYKALHFFLPEGGSASLLCGTTRPVVLTSRGDSTTTKINSLALAAIHVASTVRL